MRASSRILAAVAFAIVAAAGALVFVAEEADALSVSQDIRQNTRWTLSDSPVTVQLPIRVTNNSILTVDPGVEVRFNPGARIQVGEPSVSGTMHANGTTAQPITFRSATGSKDWPGLLFQGQATNVASTLRNVTIENVAGTGLDYRVWRNAVLSDVTVRDTTGLGVYAESSTLSWSGGAIRRAGTDGISLASTTLTASNVTIANATKYGARLDAPSRATFTDVVIEGSGERAFRGPIVTSLATTTFRDNAIPEVEFWGADVGTHTRVSHVLDATSGAALRQVVLSGIQVRGGATLTVDAGVTLAFRSGSLQVGHYSCGWGCSQERGRLDAPGTAALPIRFTSDSGARSWSGITFVQPPAGTAQNDLANVTIEHVSGNGLQLDPGANVRFADGLVRDVSGHGASVASATLVAPRSTFAQADSFGLLGDAGAAISVPGARFEDSTWALRARFDADITGVTFDGNRFAEVQLWGVTLSASKTLVPLADETTGAPITYRLLTGVAVRDRAVLTLLAGVDMALDAGQGLQIGTNPNCWGCTINPNEAGALNISGTASEPVTIRSTDGLRSRGSVLLDGRGTTGGTHMPMRIEHAILRGSSGTSLILLNHPSVTFANLTVVDNAGNGMEVHNAASTVEDSEFARNAGAGLALVNADSPVRRNTFTENGVGLSGDGTSEPLLVSNVFIENTRPIRTTVGTAWRDQAYTNSTQPVIELWGGTFTTSMTLDHLAETGGARHSFAFVSNVLVQNRANLTIAPGIDLDMRGGELRGGTNAWNGNCPAYCGSLFVRGTETERITLRNGRILLDNYHDAAFPQVVENVTFVDGIDLTFYVHYVSGKTFPGLEFVRGASRGIYQYASSGIQYVSPGFTDVRGNAVEMHAGGSARIVDADFVGTRGHAVYVNNVVVDVIGSRILDTTGYALYYTNGASGLVQDNVIDGTSGRPVRSPIAFLLENNVVTNAGVREIEIAGGDLLRNLTLDETPFASADTYTFRVTGTPVVRNGATLAIAPQQRILFEPGTGLRIGVPGSPGGLQIVGDPAQPTVLTSQTVWSGVHLDGSAVGEPPSVLEHVAIDAVDSGYGALRLESVEQLTIANATLSNNPRASGLWAVSSRFTLVDSTLADNWYSGIGLAGSSSPTLLRNTLRGNANGLTAAGSDDPTVRGNVFDANDGAPASVSIRTALDENTFRGSVVQEIWISGGDLNRAHRLPILRDNETGEAFTYVVSENPRILAPGVLTIDAGNRMEFRPGRSLVLGSGVPAGSLVAEGTTDAPIVFTSHRGSNEWSGIHVDGRWGGGASPSRIENATISRVDGNPAIRAYAHTGLIVRATDILDSAATGIYSESASPTFEDVRVLRSGGHGVDVRAGAPVFRNVTIDRTGGFGLVSDSASLLRLDGSTIAHTADRPLRIPIRATLGADNRLDAVAYPEIELLGSPSYPVSADRTLPSLVDVSTGLRVPYVALQRLDVVGATLTLAPGVTIRFAEVPVYDWRGALIGYDDGMIVGHSTASGGLRALGTDDAPVLLTSDTTRNSWGGLRFDGRVGPVKPSLLQNVTVEMSRGTGIYAYRMPQLTIEDSELRLHAVSGVHLDASPATIVRTYAHNNTQQGIHVQDADAILRGNTLADNGVGGILLTSTTPFSPVAEGNTFRDNAAAGLLASNGVRPVVADNRFSGAGRAIGVSNLATPLDVRGGDAGDAGILDGLFRPRNGGTAWFYLTPQSFGDRLMVLDYEGPAGSSIDTTLRGRAPLADFNVVVFAQSDGRIVQTVDTSSNASGELAFNILIDGARRTRIDIVPVVIADFTVDVSVPTVETPILFTNASTVLHADVALVTWDFGDGNISFGETATHRYDQKRSYLVTMELTLDSGRKYNVTKSLVVSNAAPHAGFEWTLDRPAEVRALVEDRATTLDTIRFNDTSYDVDGFIIPEFTTWDFGDDTVGAGTEPTHTYDEPGTYRVCVTVADDDLDFDTYCEELRVWEIEALAAIEVAERASAIEADANATVEDARAQVERANATVDTLNATVADALANGTAAAERAAAEIAANATAAVDATIAQIDTERADAEGRVACIAAALATGEAGELARCLAALLTSVGERADALIVTIPEEGSL